MKTKKIMATIAVLSVFFLPPGALIINPALQGLAENFPHIPYTTVLLLATVPNIVATLFTIISGAVAGSRIKYKTLLIIACAFSVIGGTAPYFLNDFNLIMACRVVMGVGLGISVPLTNALVFKMFDDQKRASMLGIGSMILCAAGMIYMTVSGLVATVNVKYMWLIHLAGLIPLLLILLFFSEPEKTEPAKTENAAKGKDKIKIPIGIYLMSITFGLLFMLVNPVLLNMSSIVIGEGLGNAAIAGTILIMYKVGGMVGGAVFKKASQITGKYIIPVALVFQILGLGICNFANSIGMLMIGAALTGMAIFVNYPAITMEIGQIVPPAGIPIASGILMGAWNLGAFASTFYMGLLIQITGNTAPRYPIFMGMVFTMAIALIWLFVKMRKKPEIS